MLVQIDPYIPTFAGWQAAEALKGDTGGRLLRQVLSSLEQLANPVTPIAAKVLLSVSLKFCRGSFHITKAVILALQKLLCSLSQKTTSWDSQMKLGFGKMKSSQPTHSGGITELRRPALLHPRPAAPPAATPPCPRRARSGTRVLRRLRPAARPARQRTGRRPPRMPSPRGW